MTNLKLNDLSLRIYEADSPRAVVQIAQGMEEHQGRYSDFAAFLVSEGFSVVSADMRGHGPGIPREELGWFADRDGWKLLIGDQLAVRDYIGERFPGLPVYLFAHSMGSIISRVVMETDSQKYARVVLSGYPCYQSAAPVGIALTALIRQLCGPRFKSKLIQRLSTGMFNRSVESPETDFDWICKTPETVRAFIDDPLCGFGFTCSAYSDLFRLVTLMHRPENYRNVNPALPMLLLSGAEDPCTGGERGRKDSEAVLRRAGFADIKTIVYPDMRHEILNERGHMQVYRDVAGFFKD